MRGPPPRFTPPSPPLTDQLSTVPTDEDEDSQYETPDRSGNRLPRPSSGIDEKSSLITSSEMPFAPGTTRNGNCYKQAPCLASEEEKHQLLKQNPQTGSYFIPHSSHTTMSTLSPQSRREKACTGRFKNMQHYHQSIDGSQCNYEPFLKQNMVSSNSSGGSTSTHSNLHPLKATIRRSGSNTGVFSALERILCSSSSRTSSEKFYRKLLIILIILILFLSLLVLYLFYSLRNVQDKYYIYDKTGSIYYRDVNDKLPTAMDHANPHLLLSIPEHFRLGELVSGDLPPGQMVYTHFSIQHDDPVQFNISVGSRARIAIYVRQTLKPTLTLYNYVQTVRGDHLHLAGIARRQKRDAEPLLKSALVQFHLLPGKWYLGFFNDGLYPEPITFVANVVKNEVQIAETKTSKTCKYECFSKGTCKSGKCHCHAGFSGEFCEETACPVLCSGNGIFSNGKCSCHEGFKGVDCDLDIGYCSVPDCSKHGICGSDGICYCDRGWTGEFCEQRGCEDTSCSNNGICQNGSCYCTAGWYGDSCEQRISSACSPLQINRLDLSQKNYQKSFLAKDTTAPSDVSAAKTSVPVIDKQPLQRKEPRECSVDCVHGFCDDGICVCEGAFGGKDCSVKQCLPGCEQHGRCNDGICECEQGWNGENCFIEGCPKNCSGTGSCLQIKGSWECACDNQHFGENCELAREMECDDGIDNDEDGLVDCEDSECCSSSACLNNPLCTSAVQPRDVLLRLQPSVDATFYNRNKFLIEPDSVQRYADSKLFNDSRASVIRGHVVSSKGGPLTGVRITDVSNIRYGFSLSRSEDGGGTFDIMVNGGGFVNLQFLRQPFGKVERSFYVPVNSIINVGKIVMNEPTTSLVHQSNISASCQMHHLNHEILPQFVPSWLLNQYAGGVKSSNDFDAEFTRIIADARIVHEAVSIEGTTDMELVYNSDRADGFKSSIYMALLPAMIPQKMRLVHVRIQLAGRDFSELLVAKPNLTYTFNWNHMNVYEQAVYGLTTATVSIGYQYENCFQSGEIVWRHEQVKIEGKKSRKSTFGLWTFGFQHYYDFLNNVLERGDGLTNYLEELPPVMRTVLGTDKQRESSCGKECNHKSLDDARLFQPNALAIASDGTLYIGDHNLIRKVNPQRTSITTVLELQAPDIVHSYYLTTDPFTNELFISIPLKRQVWTLKSTKKSIDPATNYRVVVGDGTTCGDESAACGDRGLAETAQLTFPKDITFDKLGNLYILDSRKIRYVTKEKQIHTLHTSPEWKPTENCEPIFKLNELNLEWPMAIIFEPLSAELIVLDTDVIYKLNVEAGVVRVLAGMKKGCSISSHGTHVIENVQAIALSPITGKLYIAESDSKRTNLIRSMPVNGGQLKIVAGRTSKCDCDRVNCPCDEQMLTDPVVASHSLLHKPMSLAVDSNGVVYIADQANFKIKTIEKVRATYDRGSRSYKINSAGTNEIYYFNKFGMHQRTVNLLSGQETYLFKYSVETSFGELSEIVGNGGLSLRVTRVNETDMIVEGATKTLIRQNAFDKELLDCIESTALNGRKLQFLYGTGQLLKSVNVNDKIHLIEYDDSGRVTVLSKSTGEVYSFSSEYQLRNYLFTDVLLNGHRYKRFVVQNNLHQVLDDVEDVTLSADDDIVFSHANGVNDVYETSSHPLIESQENVVLKRKTTVQSVDGNPELLSRFEWRSYVKAGDGSQVQYVGRRPRVR